ncbi:uncharacterized protein TM35_000092550 [Trypanosoma theileri]|uniref:Uncharacterized protein n=1 Tax=Trypanosoma theileri TaxID=67003 RepID=A0A1X0NZV1_9TRYP|nr:uncharacterized protein TM35_000092550 [Trypanosoma theileri]ORC90205.1 hypothetical protein TM35_000092550 [Trypanosoma theileri]
MSSSDIHSPLQNPTFSQKKRRLRAALGDLQEYSDAPPAVRRLAIATEEEEEENERERETTASVSSALWNETTAPPTPLERQSTRKSPCGDDPTTGGVLTWNINHEDGERVPTPHLSDVQAYGVGCLQRTIDTYVGSPAESAKIISLAPRARSSPSSSRISATPSYRQRRRKSDVFNTCPYWNTGRSRSFCCHCAQIFCSGSQDGEEKDDGLLTKRSKSIDKSSGNSRSSSVCTNTPTENISNSPTVCIFRQPMLIFKSLGLLKPVMFANSFPRGTTPIRLKRVPRETQNSDKSYCKKEPTKIKGSVTSTQGHHRVKILPSTVEELHHYTKPRGGESVFSLSTPRRQSTSSSAYCPNSLHSQRQAFLWSPRTQPQQQPQHFHSRVFSCSRASSEKAGHSPPSSSTFRTLPSESLEWLQQHLMLQQSHVCNLPVFTSAGPGGESGGGEGHVGLLSARTNGRFPGNNSISSLLLTRTGSNIDTLPTCCDAPLEAFMDSSSLATSSITTLT